MYGLSQEQLAWWAILTCDFKAVGHVIRLKLCTLSSEAARQHCDAWASSGFAVMMVGGQPERVSFVRVLNRLSGVRSSPNACVSRYIYVNASFYGGIPCICRLGGEDLLCSGHCDSAYGMVTTAGTWLGGSLTTIPPWLLCGLQLSPLGALCADMVGWYGVLVCYNCKVLTGCGAGSGGCFSCAGGSIIV